MQKLTSTTFLTILKSWRLWVGIAVVAGLFFYQGIAPLVRGMLLMPLFLMAAYLTHLIVRNLFHRQTSDATADTPGEVGRLWREMTPFQKILIMRLDLYVAILFGSVVSFALLFDFKAVIDVLSR